LKGHREATGLTNDTTRLFGLEGVEVVSVEIDEDDNPMLALITAADQARYCPGCAVRSEYPVPCQNLQYRP
jgi:hypothetical protein